MTQPLVSIVVPTYNRADHVETAIRSLVDQDYPALEVIALDDGSSDATPDVLDRIAAAIPSERFRWRRHDNVGQAATINRGLREARGELLGYLSDDDYLLPGAIGKLVAAAEADPEADVAYGGWLCVDEGDRVVSECGTALEHTYLRALRWGVCIVGVGALMRRRCYERIGGWDERLRLCPDYEWWLRVGEVRFAHVPEALGCWRMHATSTSLVTQDLDGVLDRLAERMRVLDDIYAGDPSEAVLAVKSEAYAATLVDAAAIIDRGLGAAGRRYIVEDRVAPMFDSVAGLKDREARLWHARELEAARRRVDELEATVARLEAARPPWLAAARGLVPPSLRPRVGAAYHRLARAAKR